MTVINIVLRFLAVIAITVILHWSLVNAYVYFCTPPSFLGLIKTLFSLGSPVCHTVNMIQYELAKHYITIWTGAGIAAAAWGVKMLKDPPTKPK